jgi:hypothetical protein
MGLIVNTCESVIQRLKTTHEPIVAVIVNGAASFEPKFQDAGPTLIP